MLKLILKSESTNKGIISSMSMSLLAKILTFLQSIVVSYYFGTQTSTDILFYVLALVLQLTTTVICVNQSIFVPLAIKIRNEKSDEESKRFIAYIYLCYLILGIAGTVLLFVFSNSFLVAFSKFHAKDIEANIAIVRFIIPAFLLIISNTYLLDMFSSYKYFTMPMFLDMLKNVLIILVVIVFKNTFSVTSLAIGVLVGNLTQFIILSFMRIKILKIKIKFKRYKIEKDSKKNILFVLTSNFTTFLYNFAIMYLISGFSSGIYTSMDYANKISTIFIAVVTTQISVVIGISLIEMHSKRDYEGMNKTFLKYFKLSLFFMIPVCCLLSINSESVIAILFGRGKFTYESVKITSTFFRYLILVIPLNLIDNFIVRLIYAKQIQRVSFYWNISSNILSITVIWICMRLMGVYGYPAGYLIANAMYMLTFSFYMLKAHFRYIDIKKIYRFLTANFFVNVTLYVLTFFILEHMGTYRDLLARVTEIAVSSALYCSVYLLSGYFIGFNRELISEILKFLRTAVFKKPVGALNDNKVL